VKLIIQVPCKNEVDNLEQTIRELPRQLSGVEEIEVLVVDDGSTDGTSRKAVELGVDHVLKFSVNRGLAKTFVTGIRFARTLGADIIVNTDGDNQYKASCIKDLIGPILEGRSGMVVGARNINSIPHFSGIKKTLQHIGSWFIGFIAGYKIPDAPCGFRAISNSTALKITVFSKYTYTLETLVQAPSKGIKVDFVPIDMNPKSRESRLMTSMWYYLMGNARSLAVMIFLYKPVWIGIVTTVLGLLCLTAGGFSFFMLPLLFSAITLTGVGLMLGGWLLTFVINLFIAERAQMEETFLNIKSEMTPVEHAKRLGASAYYKKGQNLFHVQGLRQELRA